MHYLVEASYESCDRCTLEALFDGFESRDGDQIARALAFIEERPAYRRLAERRYLRFIQARTCNVSATLDVLAEVAPPPAEVESLLAMDNRWIGIDQGSDPAPLFLLVDLAGAVVASCFDFGTYVEMTSAQLRASGDVDHSTTVEAHLSRVLADDAGVYAEGGFGRVFAKLTQMCIERVRIAS